MMMMMIATYAVIDINFPFRLFLSSQNADHVERLNETGELRIMLKPFKVISSY